MQANGRKYMTFEIDCFGSAPTKTRTLDRLLLYSQFRT